MCPGVSPGGRDVAAAPPVRHILLAARSALRRLASRARTQKGAPGDVKRLCRLAALCLGLLPPLTASGQELDIELSLAQEVFPGVTRWGSAKGDPPVYPVYGPDSETGKEVQYGYLFLTSDWPPE